MGDDVIESTHHLSTELAAPFQTPGGHTDHSLSTAVVYAIASAKDVDVLDLTEPLGSVIDPDALDRLFRPGTNGSSELTFEYSDVTVTVGSDGHITVEGPE